MIQIIAVKGLPIIRKGDDIAKLVCAALTQMDLRIQKNDILVITHVIVSVAEGNVVNLDDITPSAFAKNVAKQYKKDPAMVEVVFRESNSIRRMRNGKIITETKHGFICANSGIDKSNVSGKRQAALLPKDPDKTAHKIRKKIKQLTGCTVAVIISDTFGRPFRNGEMNLAIGVSGITPLKDRRGEKDLFGYELRVKQTAIIDELAAAAELVIGQANEGIPAAIIRGYNYHITKNATIKELIREKEHDLFI